MIMKRNVSRRMSWVALALVAVIAVCIHPAAAQASSNEEESRLDAVQPETGDVLADDGFVLTDQVSEVRDTSFPGESTEKTTPSNDRPGGGVLSSRSEERVGINARRYSLRQGHVAPVVKTIRDLLPVESLQISWDEKCNTLTIREPLNLNRAVRERNRAAIFAIDAIIEKLEQPDRQAEVHLQDAAKLLAAVQDTTSKALQDVKATLRYLESQAKKGLATQQQVIEQREVIANLRRHSPYFESDVQPQTQSPAAVSASMSGPLSIRKIMDELAAASERETVAKARLRELELAAKKGRVPQSQIDRQKAKVKELGKRRIVLANEIEKFYGGPVAFSGGGGLDVPGATPTREAKTSTNEIRVFRLQAAGAEELLSTIRSVIASDITLLSADDRTNSLVVSAPPQEMAIVSALIKELDAEHVKRFTFKLEHIPVNDKVKIGEAFRQTYSGHGNPDLYAVWGDPETNSLIVTAPAEAGHAIRQTIAEWEGQYLGIDGSSPDSESNE